MAALIVDRQGPILNIELGSDRANSIDAQTSRELGRIFSQFESDPLLRVAIISAAGRQYFCTGADLKELDALQGDVDYGASGFAGLTHNTQLTKPVIAVVNGLCVGGGLELVLACDLLICSERAEFFLSETLIGNLPYLVSMQRLLQKLPRNIAMEMLYTGRRLDAAAMAHYGVANAVVAESELLYSAIKLAENIITSAPLAVSACKRTAPLLASMSPSEAISAASDSQFAYYQQVMDSQDAREGAQAFVEKRQPKWQGK